MKKLLAAILLIPALALADNFTFTWDPPTQRIDGSPLDVNNDLQSYNFYRGSGLLALSVNKPGVGTPPPNHVDYSIGVGITTFHVTAVDLLGNESAASNFLDVIVLPPPTPTPLPSPTPTPIRQPNPPLHLACTPH